jgi:hypothetical protein
MSGWFTILFSVTLATLFVDASLRDALSELAENPYGFVICDEGVTDLDLKHFSSIDIQREWVYHQFGELERIEDSIAHFICEIGSNESDLNLEIASQLKKITEQVVEASGKETAWICLRSFVPTNRFDVPRWHVDGPYYKPATSEDLLFKFVLTLVGPPTLFYPIPRDLRKITENRIHNRQYMKSFCKQENIVSPKLGQGAILRSGQYTGITALHSEPPIHENRLFFSVVPCNEMQLPALEARVMALYPKNSKM